MGIVAFYLWLQLLAHIAYVPPSDNLSPMQMEAAKPCLLAKSKSPNGKLVVRVYGKCP